MADEDDLVLLRFEAGDVGIEFERDSGSGRFIVSKAFAQARAEGLCTDDELASINGVSIDGGDFDEALAQKLLATAPRPFTVMVRKRQAKCEDVAVEEEQHQEEDEQHQEQHQMQQQVQKEEQEEQQEKEEEEERKEEQQEQQQEDEEEEQQSGDAADVQVEETQPQAVPPPLSRYELSMQAARTEAARLLAGTAHSSKAAHAVSRLVPLRPRAEGVAAAPAAASSSSSSSSSAGPTPLQSLDTRYALEHAGQKWTAKEMDAAAHGLAFGVQAQRRRPVRLEAVWVACGSTGCRGAPLSLFVCEGEGWRTGEGDGGNTATMPRKWRRAGAGKLGAKGELARVQLRPPLLLLAGRQLGFCAHTPRHPRGIGFALQSDPSEGARSVTGADECIRVLSGGALHSADGVDGLHCPAVEHDGLAFSGRIQYTLLTQEVDTEETEDDVPINFALRNAEALDIEQQLLDRLTVEPPVEYPRRAQTRNPRGDPCFTGWS